LFIQQISLSQLLFMDFVVVIFFAASTESRDNVNFHVNYVLPEFLGQML